MERKKLKIAAILFLVVFLVSVFPLLSPVAQIQSQTREVRPQALGAPATGTETDLATGAPTYVYGVSTSGSYLSTQVNDSVYHVSTDSAVNNQQTNYATSVTYIIGSSYSGGISDTHVVDSVNHVSSDPYELDMYYTFQFTTCGVSNVTALSWSMRGFCGSTPNEVYIWNYATSTWVDTGQTLPASSGTIGGTASLQFIDSSGHMKLRIWATVAFPSIYVGVDEVHWQVTYSTYSVDFSYPSRFTGGTPNTVTSMVWATKGKTNWTTAPISLYNWINSVWDSSGYVFNSTDKTYSGAVDRNYYMQSSNGSMRMRFSQLAQARPFTISVDYLSVVITYNIAGSPSYGSAVPASNANYTSGSLTSGGIWQVMTLNSSYQVSTSGSYDSGIIDGGTLKSTASWSDWAAVGTEAWSDPTSAQSSNDAYASSFTSSGTKYTHYLKGVGFGFAVSGAVAGIKVSIEKHAGVDGLVYDAAVYLLKDGAVTGNNKALTSTSWSTTDAVTDYGADNDGWGAGLVADDVNNGNFGVVLEARMVYGADVENAYVDYISITVYMFLTRYKLDCSYQLQFTDAAKANVYQLGWLVNGKMSLNASTIYLYNWGGATWDSTGQTLTSTQGDKGSSSVSVTDYMAANGSVLIRFYLTNQAASFTASIDFMRIDIIYASISDTTPPGTPNLFYPLNDQALANGTLLVWNATSDDAGGSGISYYQLQLSDGVKPALSFNGATDYVIISYSSSFDVHEITIAFWLKIPTHISWQVFVTRGTWGAEYPFLIGEGVGGQLYSAVKATGGTVSTYWGYVIPLNTWIYVTMTYDAVNGLQCYVNGVLEASASPNGDMLVSPYNNDVWIGTSWIPDNYMNGYMSGLQMYSRALGLTEIQYDYSNKVLQSTIGLLVYYLFNEGSGSSLYDSSGNGYTGTITGATWTTFIDPTFGFLLPTYDKTTDRTWYQFGYGDLAFTEWYWRVRAVDRAGNQGNWSAVRHFYETADPQVYIVLRDQNNAAINEYLNLAAFNITYHRSIEDGAGVWNTLSPYMPVINMFSSETVNITVRDWLGNYIVNNQTYTYSPTILVNLDIWDVCIGNGADQMAYIIMRSGSVFLHQFTYRSDLHWLVIAGNYNLTVIYPAVGNAQVYYNLSITGDYGIKVSSDLVADLYSATDNWEALTGNVANIVTKVNGIEREVYSFGDSEVSTREKIGTVDSLVRGVADNANILNWIIAAFAIAVVIALFSIWGRVGARRNQEDIEHFKEITNATDRQVTVITNEELKRKAQGG